MTPTLTLTDVSGSTLTEAVCLSFRLEKERYTPFTTLTARFLTSRSDFGNPASVAFRLDNQLLHQGVLDGLTMTKQKGMQTVQVSSRGFTSLLMQNQIAAGMLTGVTLQSLMEKYTVPGVTYESGITQTNYVWVKEGTSQWDAIVNYGYKYNQGYPYISGANQVRLTRSETASITIGGDALLSTGCGLDYTRMVSHIHMADADGNADAFSLENADATARNIARHRQEAPVQHACLSGGSGGVSRLSRGGSGAAHYPGQLCRRVYFQNDRHRGRGADHHRGASVPGQVLQSAGNHIMNPAGACLRRGFFL